jgi:hypothetical protein
MALLLSSGNCWTTLSLPNVLLARSWDPRPMDERSAARPTRGAWCNTRGRDDCNPRGHLDHAAPKLSATRRGGKVMLRAGHEDREERRPSGRDRWVRCRRAVVLSPPIPAAAGPEAREHRSPRPTWRARQRRHSPRHRRGRGSRRDPRGSRTRAEMAAWAIIASAITPILTITGSAVRNLAMRRTYFPPSRSPSGPWSTGFPPVAAGCGSSPPCRIPARARHRPPIFLAAHAGEATRAPASPIAQRGIRPRHDSRVGPISRRAVG